MQCVSKYRYCSYCSFWVRSRLGLRREALCAERHRRMRARTCWCRAPQRARSWRNDPCLSSTESHHGTHRLCMQSFYAGRSSYGAAVRAWHVTLGRPSLSYRTRKHLTRSSKNNKLSQPLQTKLFRLSVRYRQHGVARPRGCVQPQATSEIDH